MPVPSITVKFCSPKGTVSASVAMEYPGLFANLLVLLALSVRIYLDSSSHTISSVDTATPVVMAYN
eukprot:6328880-Pyramimonas_sp.AAC.1